MEMREEAKRAALAVEEAKKGNNVALVSGGDPGIYAMASVLFGYLRKIGEDVDVEIIPGITAAIAAAACLGAPLGHDFAVISLSDILTSWDVIERRIKEAAKGDFVVVFYNPKSKQRKWQIGRAKEILMKYRDPNTPVGLVKNAMRKGEEKILTTLEKMERHPIDMSTTVIVGNSKTFVYRDKMITPRE
jgi:precorrin-3B C17-methyltransferase